MTVWPLSQGEPSATAGQVETNIESTMPVLYQIALDKGRIHTRCVGEVAFPEVLDHFRVLEEDPDFRDGLDVLLDLSELASWPTPDQLQAVGGKLERIQPKARFGACAIVAPRDVLFGLSRMFMAVAAEHFQRMSVFRSADEAEGWLRSFPPPDS